MKDTSLAYRSQAGFIAGALLACASASAADITKYTAAKGRLYNQTSAAAPTAQSSSYQFVGSVEGNVDAISSAILNTPSGFPFELPLDASGTRYEFAFPADSAATLNSVFANGNYGFTIDSDSGGTDIGQVSLNSSAYPAAIPQISNFTSTESANASADLTLTFNALGDAGGFEFVLLQDGMEIFLEEGTGTSVTIPAGTLDIGTTYTARLRFIKEVDREIAMIPSAVGTAELFNETEFLLSTTGSGGGEDTTPPFLFSTTPSNGATGVGINSSVSFNFSEEMQPTQSIQWSANLNTSLFTYTWTGGGRTLVANYGANLPADATITWQLNPNPANLTNFKDVAGNQLAAANLQGSFTTSSGTTTNDPCDPNPVDDGRGFGSIMKGAFYVQTGNNTPVPDTEMPAMFSGSYRGASNQNVTAVSLTGPAGTKNFQNLFGFYLLSEEYNSAAAMDVAVPAGTYTINAQGAGSANLNLGNISQIPVPRLGNLTALQQMDVTQPFTLTFDPFTGAGPNDTIFISISGGEGDGSFHAPDFCRNIELPNTATSVVIPANTFRAGKEFRGSISFTRSTFDTNAIPGTSVSGGASVTTEFGFTSGGGDPQPTQPQWTGSQRNADGTITFTLSGTAGTQVIIEESTNLQTWTTAGTGTLTGGTFQFTVDPRLAPRKMYRARVQ